MIAKAAGVPLRDAEAALGALIACHILKKTEVELEDEPVEVYMLDKQDSFVPFMLLARWLCDGEDAYFCNWVDRKDPILREDTAHENK